MAQLTDLGEIRTLCEKHGFAFSKQYGQNFIVNAGICPKICTAAEVSRQTNVLEIGPGFGTLTTQLAQRANKVLAIELDKRLLPVLDETLAEHSNVTVIQGDALKVDFKSLIDEYLDGSCIVCANLPYYITSPVLMRLLEEELPVQSICAMVQREAAERIAAKTGTRKAGAISYAVSYYSDAKIMFNVKPGSFYPPPNVESSVIRLVLKQPALHSNEEARKRLFSLVKAAFSARRKTLANAVSNSLGIEKTRFYAALEQIGIKKNARAEELTLEDFINLEKALFAK